MHNQSTVFVPFGLTWLVLSPEQFREALQRGQEFVGLVEKPGQATFAEDRVLDAEGMEAATGIPATWFLEQARQRRIPHIRAGKYVRFRLSEVLAALHLEVHTDRRSVAPRKRATGQ